MATLPLTFLVHMYANWYVGSIFRTYALTIIDIFGTYVRQVIYINVAYIDETNYIFFPILKYRVYSYPPRLKYHLFRFSTIVLPLGVESQIIPLRTRTHGTDANTISVSNTH